MRPSRRQTLPFIGRWPSGRPSATAVLVALSVGAYVSQLLLDYSLAEHGPANLLQTWLALDGESIRAGQYWTFLTYSLLHADPFHMLASALLLYLAGKEVEPIIGSRHFVTLYLLATVLGGVAHWLAMPSVPLVGAVPAVAAVIIAFTTILPELDVTVNLFFVLPLRLRAKYLAAALLVVAAILWTVPTLPQIGPVAILAASAVAWIYVKQLGFGNPLAIQRFIFERRQRAARLDRMTAEQFISNEIDPILDKIAREGMQSLSRTERKLLARGRDKIAAKAVRK
jgi:membrane associated rhomboid family serine protease